MVIGGGSGQTVALTAALCDDFRASSGSETSLLTLRRAVSDQLRPSGPRGRDVKNRRRRRLKSGTRKISHFQNKWRIWGKLVSMPNSRWSFTRASAARVLHLLDYKGQRTREESQVFLFFLHSYRGLTVVLGSSGIYFSCFI